MHICYVGRNIINILVHEYECSVCQEKSGHRKPNKREKDVLLSEHSMFRVLGKRLLAKQKENMHLTKSKSLFIRKPINMYIKYCLAIVAVMICSYCTVTIIAAHKQYSNFRYTH